MDSESDLLKRHGFIRKTKLGSGTFGAAFLVKSTHDEKEFVLKQIPMDKHAKQEVSLLKKMDHPYIVHYEKSFEENGSLFIVMEHCGMGDLSKILETQKNKKAPFEMKEVLDWFVQICLALKHVHDKNIIHRDIKPQNIFVTTEGTLRLGDFGISKELPGSHSCTTSCAGTPVYMAPEICKQPYTFSSDIWSLGLVLYNLCKLDYTMEDYKAANRGETLRLPDRYSDLQDLLNQLLQRIPHKRPTINDILMTPILARRIPKNHSVQTLNMEFNRDMLTSMGVDDSNTFLEDEELIREIRDELDENIMAFSDYFQEDNLQNLQKQIKDVEDITNKFESMHRSITLGNLTGGVIGVAGGITSIIGLILAPFSFGASMIVTAVGVGVAVAGGVSNITNVVQQKRLCKEIEDILTNAQETINHKVLIVNKIKRSLSKLQEYSEAASSSTSTNVNPEACSQTYDTVDKLGLLQLFQFAKLASVGRLAAQAVKVANAVSKTTAVVSSLTLILDIALVAKDITGRPKISQVDQTENKSDMLKFINEMRNTAALFEDAVREFVQFKNVLDNDIIPHIRETVTI